MNTSPSKKRKNSEMDETKLSSNFLPPNCTLVDEKMVNIYVGYSWFTLRRSVFETFPDTVINRNCTWKEDQGDKYPLTLSFNRDPSAFKYILKIYLNFQIDKPPNYEL